MHNVPPEPLSEVGAKVDLVCHMLPSPLRKKINVDIKIRCQPPTKILQWPPILLSIRWKFHTLVHKVLSDLSLSFFLHQLVLFLLFLTMLQPHRTCDDPVTMSFQPQELCSCWSYKLEYSFPGSWNTVSSSGFSSCCTTSENLSWWLALYNCLSLFFWYNLLS